MIFKLFDLIVVIKMFIFVLESCLFFNNYLWLNLCVKFLKILKYYVYIYVKLFLQLCDESECGKKKDYLLVECQNVYICLMLCVEFFCDKMKLREDFI